MEGLPLMNDYIYTLQKVYTKELALQSAFARRFALEVAEAASRGHITSVLNGLGKNRWFITEKGLSFLSLFTKDVLEEQKDA